MRGSTIAFAWGYHPETCPRADEGPDEQGQPLATRLYTAIGTRTPRQLASGCSTQYPTLRVFRSAGLTAGGLLYAVETIRRTEPQGARTSDVRERTAGGDRLLARFTRLDTVLSAAAGAGRLIIAVFQNDVAEPRAVAIYRQAY